ncbi:hypothetical protein PENNAL_c0533G01745 [Penicillium nalgiovense]|nr:hypothetical protein PENNAL_c0533G01745 [Penicillium nalgiovense]
MLYGGAL